MSENQHDNPTQTGDLGAMPEVSTEPRESNPGGVDALPDDDEIVPADLDPDSNPAAEESPDLLKEGEDTDTEATRSPDGSEEEIDPEDEAPV